jgi:hypothetical protein
MLLSRLRRSCTYQFVKITRLPLELIAAALASVAVVSCYSSPLMAPIAPEPGPVSNYTLGLVRAATPGQVMIERTEGSGSLPGFELERPIRVQHLTRQPPGAAGAWMARFEYKGTCSAGRYVVTNRYFYGARLGIIVSEDGTIACPHPVLQLGGAKKGRAWDLEEPLPFRPFRPTKVAASMFPGAVRWELVFLSYANDKLTVEYREFPGQRIRRKFRWGDIEYDVFELAGAPTTVRKLVFNLASDKSITYRGVTMDVTSAAPDQLVFRVVNESAPEPPPASSS